MPAEHTQREFYRLPSDCPQFKPLSRRATHNRLLDDLADLKRSLRASLCDYQTMRGRVRSVFDGRHTRPENQTALTDL